MPRKVHMMKNNQVLSNYKSHHEMIDGLDSVAVDKQVHQDFFNGQ